jgi:hypothetical protein
MRRFLTIMTLLVAMLALTASSAFACYGSCQNLLQ